MIKIDGLKLSLALAKVSMSAKELAEESGVSEVTITRFKTGTQKARPKTLGKISKVLGIRPEDLMSNK